METAAPGAGLVNAQLLATVAYADGSGGASRIVLYDAVPADARSVPVGAVLSEVVLAKPCGVVAGELLTLVPASAGGSMVLASGLPRWARWVRADGALVHSGDVSDMQHAGFFRLQGGVTPDGESTPSLQAGGLVLFGALVLG